MRRPTISASVAATSDYESKLNRSRISSTSSSTMASGVESFAPMTEPARRSLRAAHAPEVTSVPNTPSARAAARLLLSGKR
jgi:hypothetical protein